MFFIKFNGKIENVRGNAENIFNFRVLATPLSFFKVLKSFNFFSECFTLQKIFRAVCSSEKKIPEHFYHHTISKVMNFLGWLSIRKEIVRVSEKTVQISKRTVHWNGHNFFSYQIFRVLVVIGYMGCWHQTQSLIFSNL